MKLSDYDVLALYSPTDIKTLVEKFGTDNLPAVAVFGEGTLRAAVEAGITVLEDQSALVTFKDGRQLQLSGILDTTRNVRKRLPKRQSPDIPQFLLSHRPETDRILSHGDVDIVISGHTHGGQVCPPFGLLRFEASPDHALPYTYPWHISGGNTYLITKGLGTSTLPLRFNCPPEIYLLELH